MIIEILKLTNYLIYFKCSIVYLFEEHNQILSENRAKSVYNYLIENGIAKDRLSYKGFGESIPKYTNETKEGRQGNRRTEYVITGM